MESINVRSYAVEALMKIERENAYSNIVIREALSRLSLSAEDRKLFTTIVYGTLQNKIYLDWLLSKIVHSNYDRIDLTVKIILESASYQVFFLDRVPDYAIVNESVKIAQKKKKKAVGFVNGVLRQLLRQKDDLKKYDFSSILNEKERLSLRYSLPLGIVHKFYETFGTELGESLITEANSVPPFTIRVNSLKTNRNKLQELLEADGIKTKIGLLSPDALHIDLSNCSESDIRNNKWFKNGYFTVQDQGAMMLSEILDPKQGECILDMCAAPGGKTTHIAQLMLNTGEITARDIYNNRLLLVENTAKRLGINNIQCECTDSSLLNPIDIQKYDRILLDAPCSGMGIIRRKPEIRYHNDKKERKMIRSLQKKMLDNAVMMLRNGGVLVYSTCTIIPEENEFQIESFLKDHPEMKIERMGYTHFKMDGADCFYFCRMKKNNKTNDC